jgi:hyperosmotically inducible protein
MNSKLMTIAVVVGALSLPLAGYTADDKDSDRSSPKAFVKDSVITAKIKAKMAADREVSAMHIKVDTDDKGIVTLSGTAKTPDEASKAVSLARSVEGVVDVKDRIQVAARR